MKNLAILFLVLGIGFLFGGYYLMQNNLNNKPIVLTFLTCSRTASDDNYSATISYKFNYRGRNIDTINYIVDFDYSNVSDDDFNEVSNIDVCTQLKNELDSKDLKFSNCDKKIDDRHIIVTSVIDKNSFGNKRIKSANDVTEILEKKDFKCDAVEG